MRTRNGYVSNSSSSSFILMYNDDSKLVVSGRSKDSGSFDFTVEDLTRIIEHSNNYCSDCTSVIADGIGNVKAYLTEKDEYGYCHYVDEYSKEILRKIGENGEKYREAMILRIAYDDKIVRRLIDMFVKSGEMVSIGESED